MPTFEKCDKSVEDMAKELIGRFDSHKPLADCEVKIDFVFAHADVDDKGRVLNDALTKGGMKALGITRKIALKDRVLGRGDAEISLDGDWWEKTNEEEQAALLDHELHHVSVKCDRSGRPQFDDIGRPLIKLRKHDVEVGWFKIVAERHGAASVERQQAKQIMDDCGQYFWPGIAPTIELSTPDGRTTGPIALGRFNKIAKEMAGAK